MRSAQEIWMLVVALLCTAITALGINLLIPNFKAVFVDFGAELPLLTVLFVEYGWLLWLMPLSTLMLWLFLPANERKPNRRGVVTLLVAIGMCVVALPLALISTYLPIFRLGAVAGG